LVQEKYRGEKACDKRRGQQHNNNNNNNNNCQGTGSKGLFAKRGDPYHQAILAEIISLSLSLHLSLYTGCNLLYFQYTISLNSNLCTALMRKNTKKNDSINLHAQDITALHPTVFLTGIHQILP
jgi:hypothetical protein